MNSDLIFLFLSSAPCPYPPEKAFLQKELNHEIEDRYGPEKTLPFDSNNDCTIDWLVVALSTITNGKHPIFAKNYLKPRHENSSFTEWTTDYFYPLALQAYNDGSYNDTDKWAPNYDSFFENLPNPSKAHVARFFP